MENQEKTEFDRDVESRNYVCPVCGKAFHIPIYVNISNYVYVISVYDEKTKANKTRKCCSYTCYRKGK